MVYFTSDLHLKKYDKSLFEDIKDFMTISANVFIFRLCIILCFHGLRAVMEVLCSMVIFIPMGIIIWRIEKQILSGMMSAWMPMDICRYRLSKLRNF